MKLRQNKKMSIKFLTRKMLKKRLKESSAELEAAYQKIEFLEFNLAAKDLRVEVLSGTNSNLIKENLSLKKAPKILNLFKRKGHASYN
ncbi:hypothetical protein [Cellulosilyticum sp. I15G10I2]|uniref:hypothetical protein n=1 Tax=Cellulosilyticum sp. I15G10I2 TaxID=1892843 RepID=UPI00085CC893|nr:hypothetical protein [Cellulosilyticum sp. I15G10I2]